MIKYDLTIYNFYSLLKSIIYYDTIFFESRSVVLNVDSVYELIRDYFNEKWFIEAPFNLDALQNTEKIAERLLPPRINESIQGNFNGLSELTSEDSSMLALESALLADDDEELLKQIENKKNVKKKVEITTDFFDDLNNLFKQLDLRTETLLSVEDINLEERLTDLHLNLNIFDEERLNEFLDFIDKDNYFSKEKIEILLNYLNTIELPYQNKIVLFLSNRSRLSAKIADLFSEIINIPLPKRGLVFNFFIEIPGEEQNPRLRVNLIMELLANPQTKKIFLTKIGKHDNTLLTAALYHYREAQNLKIDEKIKNIINKDEKLGAIISNIHQILLHADVDFTKRKQMLLEIIENCEIYKKKKIVIENYSSNLLLLFKKQLNKKLKN